jgi:methionine aminopeptidase
VAPEVRAVTNQKSVSLPRHRSSGSGKLHGRRQLRNPEPVEKQVTVVRELVGHGIGQKPPSGLKFRTTVSVARVEAANRTYTQPMVNLGTKSVTRKRMVDHPNQRPKPSAHFEHTIVVQRQGGNLPP